MKKYKIIMDVSGDIDEKFACDNDISFIPMEYSLGSEFRICDGFDSIDKLKEFYDSQRNGDFTKTTQITPFIYEEFFRTYVSEGIDIIYIALSSGLSKTYESALLAVKNLKEEFKDSNIMVVDSLCATGGMGLITSRAVKNRDRGLSIIENFYDLVNISKRIRNHLMVEDLNYLKRGGRVSTTSALVGSILGIKPIIDVDKEGKLINIAKCHGSKKAALHIINMFKENRDELEKHVYVCHADNDEYNEFIIKKLLSIDSDLVIDSTMLSPIIGAHTGPGMCIISYIGK